ncbi:DUF4932 domain-containing protein [Polaribacter porphyrae]|uniref:DUF4932 domain-containing protein n=1 Tax=Polaribacter porphyrae TaxID=1137780 RepID=A0A2S7WR72_9FLAO|nr:DUF4932 domain-containing protein [Polaribacter porphyrae]PQJ80113.1 hypothetical protein BTO18_13425 [Polaribacter porphyrae]
MKLNQSFKIVIYSFLLIFFISSCKSSEQESIASDKIISVQYPETYELANIILALTQYGKIDVGEVRKDFDYYNKVMKYFKPVMNHSLLDSVNYSRKKWEDYLSFRTDSYAFEFDENNQLKRKINFYTNKGFQPFDNHLDLINDFVKKSKFRDFFKQNKAYYTAVSDKYEKTQYLNEMREFLIEEFGEQYSIDNKYNVVLSPFVYRMNCHRNIDSLTVADFITIPDYVLSDTISINKQNIATSIHSLFTEMDHGYVNPTTDKFKELVNKNFDAKLWDNKSGYNENGGFGVFNEYMTWGIYDIFLQKHFPNLADEVGLYWSFQNDSRGFEYSRLFTQQLLMFYNTKKEDETIKDLYPKMLEWTSEVQKNLSKPEIISPKDVLITNLSEKTKINISFSEPMKKSDTITVKLQDRKFSKAFIDLNAIDNNLKWSTNGTSVEFEMSLNNKLVPYYLQFNWWGTKHPLISKKGVLIKSAKYFKITNENPEK